MKPSRDELRARLEGQAAPEPRTEFVDRLGHRLRAIDPSTADTHVPVFRRPPWRGYVALAATAAVVALLFGVLPRGAHDGRVDVTGQPPAGQPEQGEPGPTAPPEVSTTTVPAAGTGTTIAHGPNSPTTTVPSPATNAVPVLPSGPVTTARPIATTRPPRPATTTTTTAPPAEPEALTLDCVAGQPEGSPGVQCQWSGSTSPTFYAYRLWRATGTEAKQAIYSVPNRTTTTYIDRPTTGLQHYMVEAYDSNGQVSGRSPVVEVTCC
ncbi:MAG: hypothetical protein QOE35_2747 [Actinomycetota bacterium]